MSVDDFFQGTSSTPTKNYKFATRVKLNFDSSLQNNSAAGGYMLHDQRGAILTVGATNYGNTSISMAKGRALRNRIQATVVAGYRMLDIKGDNLIVLGALQRKIETPWQIQHAIKEIQVMLSQAVYMEIKHIYREVNMVADWLSKYGHSITDALSIT